MDSAKFQLRSTVDQVIAKFESIIESRDVEIANLKRLNEESNHLIAQLRKKADVSLQSFEGSNPPIQLSLSEQCKDHKLCHAKLRQSTSRYDKLLGEAQTQTQHARTLESSLEKAQAKIREWQAYFQSQTAKSFARPTNKTRKSNLTSCKSPFKNAKAAASVTSSVNDTSDEQSITRSTSKIVPRDGLSSSYNGNRDQCSSPCLPPYFSADSRAFDKTTKLLTDNANKYAQTDKDEAPTSVSTEVMADSINEEPATLDLLEINGFLTQLPKQNPKVISSPSSETANPDCLQRKQKGGSPGTPISLTDESSGPVLRPSSFSEGLSFGTIALDRSLQAGRHESPRKRKLDIYARQHSILDMCQSDKRSASEPPATQLSRPATQRHEKPVKISPLHEIDGNVRRTPKTNFRDRDEPSSKKQKTRQQKAIEAIGEIAEDGDDHIGRKSPRTAKDPIRQDWNKRFFDMLEGKPPDYPVLTSPLNLQRSKKQKTRTPVHETQSAATIQESSPNKDRIQSTAGRRSASKGSSAAQKIHNPDKRFSLDTPTVKSPKPKRAQIAANPVDGPLRSRPLDQLSLEHFKINPAKNDGLPFAYTDVVRNRAQRQCLPGCTRPDCCGDQFRALAAHLPPGLSASSTTDATTDADTRLLCTYLGEPLSTAHNPHPSPTILALSEAERARLLQEARTKDTADRFGKMHRRRHARAPTPPGFWETDIPGTQEMEEERREARERVREIVRERWLEARRGRGKGVWMFVDE